MKKEYGLTIIELMVVILLMSILAMTAIPSFKSTIDDKQLKVVGPLFEKTMLLARSEARKGQDIIRVSPMVDSNDWSKGWKIERIISEDEKKLIRQFDPLPGSPSFSSEQFSSINPIELLPSGQASSVGEFHLTLKNCSDNVKHVFRLLLSGQLSKSSTKCLSE